MTFRFTLRHTLATVAVVGAVALLAIHSSPTVSAQQAKKARRSGPPGPTAYLPDDYTGFKPIFDGTLKGWDGDPEYWRVEDKVIVEVKSVEKVKGVHKKQLLTHLRLMDKKLGLLINFNQELIKDGISRVVNGLE